MMKLVHLFIKCFYVTNVYLTSLRSYALQEFESNHFKIDNIIRQLLTSKKFDQLVDIIAEKAVDKIRRLDHKYNLVNKYKANLNNPDVTNVYLTSLRSYALQEFESNHFKIDNIIRQLLTSKKFDQLVDIIAEKAVDKIRRLDHKYNLVKSEVNDRNKKHNIIQHSNRGKHELKNLNEKHNEEVSATKIKKPFKKYLNQDTKRNNEIGKINLQTFIKEDSSLKSENLMLNYKFLTEKIRQQDRDSEKLPKKYDTSSVVLRNGDNLGKHESINKDNIDNKTQNYDALTDTSHEENSVQMENEDVKKLEKMYDGHVMINIYHKGDNKQPNHYLVHKNEENHSERKDIQKHDVESKDKAKTNIRVSSNKVESNMNENEISNEVNKIKDTQSEYLQKESVMDNEYDDSKVQDGPNIKSNDSTEHKINTHFRIEGNKTFVFQSLPEYDEYHEEYDKSRKKNPELEFL